MSIERLRQRVFGFGAGTILLVACATSYSPPLTSRGIPAEERRDYVIQNGFGIPEHIKIAFLEGYLVEGMTREMVYHLFGTPDRAADRDTRWEYVNRKGEVITGVQFKGDKIEKIDGDPSGGAGMPPAAPVPGP